MKKNAFLMILLASVLWATLGIFGTEMSKIGFSSLQISSLRITGAAIFFILTVWITDKNKFKIKIKDLWLFAVMGVGCVLGMSVLYFYTLINTSLPVASILLYTSPIWVIIISAIVFKEKITLQKFVALICAFAGCILVSLNGGGSGIIGIWFFITGLLSGLAYGMYSILGSVALKKYHPYTVTTYAFIFGAISSWFVANPLEIMAVAIGYPDKPVVIMWMVLVGLVTSYMAFMFYTLGLLNTTPGKAAIMACADPLTSTIFGILIYGQKASFLGMLLIFLAIGLVNNFGISKQKNTP